MVPHKRPYTFSNIPKEKLINVCTRFPGSMTHSSISLKDFILFDSSLLKFRIKNLFSIN